MNDSRDSGSAADGWRSVLSTVVRLVFFRISQVELTQLGWQHLAVGLICTWLVGMGRYWDNPRVGLLQHLGIGSLVYIFILSLFLWLLIWPLRPRHWSYFRVLTFISLVSPPAVLYAIPVEKFVNLLTANEINAWFLAIVATWRVALLIFFLRRLAELDWFSVITATLLPLTLIVVALAQLNLEKVVMSLMGGMGSPSPNDGAYVVLAVLSLLAYLLFLPLVICYLGLVVKFRAIDRFKKRNPGN
jgi:hypothetical protein